MATKFSRLAVKAAMAAAQVDPGAWIAVGDGCSVRFSMEAAEAAVVARKPRLNWQAAYRTEETRANTMETLVRNLVSAVDSGDEEFLAACLADARMVVYGAPAPERMSA